MKSAFSGTRQALKRATDAEIDDDIPSYRRPLPRLVAPFVRNTSLKAIYSEHPKARLFSLKSDPFVRSIHQ